MENETEKKVIERRRDRKKERDRERQKDRDCERKRQRQTLTLLDLPLSDSSDWLVGTYPAAAESAGSTGCTWRLDGILRYRTVAI